MTSNYPLTLTLDYRSAAHQQVLFQTTEGNALIQCEEFYDNREKRHKINLVSHQRQRQRHFCIEAAKGFSFKPSYDIWDEQGRSMTSGRAQPIGAIQLMRQWVSWHRDECHVYQGQQLAFKVGAADRRDSWITLVGVGVMILGAVAMAYGQVLLGCVLICLGGYVMDWFRQGYLFNSTYIVRKPDGRRVMQFTRTPSRDRFRSQFTVQAVDRLNESEEFSALLGVLFAAFKAHSVAHRSPEAD
jgi:hypothetical protein